jgi:CBS domain-containing membrane protein
MPENPEGRDISPPGLELKDEDIYEAMKQIPGYLDITPADFKEVYSLAYRHAVARLSRSVTAGDIMTREVTWVTPDTPLADVAAAMGQRGVSGVPVVDRDGKVVGVISQKDFLTHLGVTEPQNFMALVASCLKTKACVALPIKKQQARDLMSAPPVTVGEDTPVRDIAALFTARRINRVPVTDPEGRLRGLVSRADLIRSFTHGARP